ncbi:MAG: hypothetical protein ACP5MD_16705, partial [Verrucomicrobiia bacterium]
MVWHCGNEGQRMGLKGAPEAVIGRDVEQRSQASPLERPVTVLRGVGSERAALLARLGIRSVEDLLLHRPRRYEDRRVIGR